MPAAKPLVGILTDHSSIAGASMCWNEAMLARIHVGRSMTSTIAGPESERRPVVSSIWSSRRGMMPVKSTNREVSVLPLRPAMCVATCSARRQSMGSAVATQSRLFFPVPIRRVPRCSDLLQIATDEADDRQDRNEQQDHAEPVVEDHGCHAGQRSERSVGPRTPCRLERPPSTDAAVAVEILVEALLDARQQVGGHLVVPALGGDDLAQLGLEVEGLQTVGAAGEMGMDGCVSVFRQRAVEERLELADRVSTVIHSSVPSQVDSRSRQPALVAQQTRTTSCASLFFPDGGVT